MSSYYSSQFRTHNTAVRVWDAILATSAASVFFEPFAPKAQTSTLEFGPSEFHNPIEIVYNEARSLWPEREIILVSIGAGAAPRNKFSGILGKIIETAQMASTGAEAIARKFEQEHTGTSVNTSLYRFNVREGLSDIGLEEYKSLKALEAESLKYLWMPDTSNHLLQCIRALSEINYEGLCSLLAVFSQLIVCSDREAQRNPKVRDAAIFWN